MTALRFDPALPWWAIAALAGLALLVAAFALWRGLRGWAWRGLAGLAAALALAGPAGHRLRLDALEARARQLTADVELDFMAMVAALKRDNPHTASRLLP